MAAGSLLAAVDVWPTEPVPPDHHARALDGLVLSAHRAGGIPEAFASIGDMVVDDLAQIARGLPPVRMQVASPGTGQPLPQPPGHLTPVGFPRCVGISR